MLESNLKLAIVGDEMRFLGAVATYEVTLENPGSAPAHNVSVVVSLPLASRLVGVPPVGACWDAARGKLIWKIARLEPGKTEKVRLTLQVRLGGVGIHEVSVEARADGPLAGKASCRTVVSALSDLAFEVLVPRRVVDVDDFTTFTIRIKNIGKKDATNLLVRAVLSEKIEPVETRNGTDRTPAQYDAAKNLMDFPPIDRLGPGKEIVLGVKVKAKQKGLATCRDS